MQLKVKGDFRTRIKILEEQKAKIEGKGDFYVSLAMLLNSSIQVRVQKDGKGSDGLQMSKYSDAWSKKKI